MSGADGTGGATGAAFDVAPFTAADVAEVFALWRACEGIGLFGETEAMVCDCLARSPGLSFVARSFHQRCQVFDDGGAGGGRSFAGGAEEGGQRDAFGLRLEDERLGLGRAGRGLIHAAQ